MNKTWIILQREYLTRVLKKSFILTTLLVPLFLAAIMIIPAWLATRQDKEIRNIAVFDETSLFLDQLGEEGFTKYQFIEKEKYLEVKSDIEKSGYYALLYIPGNLLTTDRVELLSPKQLPIEMADQIERKLSQIIETDKRNKVIQEIGVPDLEWGELPLAITVLKKGQKATPEELMEFCRVNLSSFKRPRSVVFVDELPRNPMGKVLKRVLRDQYAKT